MTYIKPEIATDPNTIPGEDIRQTIGLGIQDLLTSHREQILAIANQHGAYNVRVFGSVARGEARVDSDVDLLVEFLPGRNLLDRIGLIQDLEELLGRKVDVAKLSNLPTEIRETIKNEAIAL